MKTEAEIRFDKAKSENRKLIDELRRESINYAVRVSEDTLKAIDKMIQSNFKDSHDDDTEEGSVDIDEIMRLKMEAATHACARAVSDCHRWALLDIENRHATPPEAA